MHASPHRLPNQERRKISLLRSPASPRNTLKSLILRFLHLLRVATLRAFAHDAFALAKASAYSAILTFFPALLVVGSVLATTHTLKMYLREISDALSRIMPAGRGTAQAYLKGTTQHSAWLLFTTSLLTLWLASGVMVSWMDGFRRAYELPKTWGLIKERMISFSLVIMAGVPLTFATGLVVFGSRIETTILHYLGHEFSALIFVMWMVIRWLIAMLTSVAVIALIYHNAVPRTQPWHSVLPGAILATATWFAATMVFGWYLQSFADYSILYGSLGVGIALLVWMYIISLVILIGAEFNALLFPRAMLGKELNAVKSSGIVSR